MQDWKAESKEKRRGLWPVYGLFMGVALAAISYIAAPSVQRIVVQFTRGGFTGQELPPDQMRLFFTFVIFIILASVAGFIVALAIPKKKTDIKDKQLKVEKEEMRKAKRARRVRKQVVERELKKQKRRS